jgi:hypothetical protein
VPIRFGAGHEWRELPRHQIKEDKMTRKDYVVIAEVIKNLDEVIDSYALEVLADNMAEALESDNPRFDRARFLVACGVK